LRQSLLRQGQAAFDAVTMKIGPWSIAALLLTLVLLFAFQGEAILKQPLVIALLAVPIDPSDTVKVTKGNSTTRRVKEPGGAVR